jgi:alpha-glucosidase (family GH31 glycosyl hydrolase)
MVFHLNSMRHIAQNRFALSGLGLIWCLGAASCQKPTLGNLKSVMASEKLGPWTISASETGLQILHQEKIIFETPANRAYVGAALGQATVVESRGSFRLTEKETSRCSGQTVSSLSASAQSVTLKGTLACQGNELEWLMSLTPAGEGRLGFSLSVTGDQNRVFLLAASEPKERIFGFGEQFSHFDMKGLEVPILVREQGIGRGDQPVTAGANLTAGSGGSPLTTYIAVPHYITSRARSLFLKNSEYSNFDLRSDNEIVIEAHAQSLVGELFAGDTPLELLSRYTEATGRMRKLPDWVTSGVVLGLQGGPTRVREAVQKVQRQGVPIAAVWLQDWVGQRTTNFGKQLWWNWELDSERYPDWASLVAELAAQKIRVLTYVNPFFANDVTRKMGSRRNLFDEAQSQGFLVKNQAGETYLIPNTDFSAGLVDLSNPAARTWMKQIMKNEVIAVGASGWMADFGEALPFDAVLFSQEPAALWHNKYPDEWAKLNREAVAEAGRTDDIVFFSRSGFTNAPAQSSLFWLGDQLTSWDQNDGLKSAITGLVSGGTSGFTLNHSDIGGYTALKSALGDYVRSPELFRRWAEFAAFTTVFRTHEGNRPSDNAQFDADEKTLAAFSRSALMYNAWSDYRKTLIAEANTKGWPVVRHLYLENPDDASLLDIRGESFLVGSELLVAPVTEPGANQVAVRFPKGRWVHVWSERVYEGGRWTVVEAPEGQPAVFFKEGSLIGAEIAQRLRSIP